MHQLLKGFVFFAKKLSYTSWNFVYFLDFRDIEISIMSQRIVFDKVLIQFPEFCMLYNTLEEIQQYVLFPIWFKKGPFFHASVVIFAA